MTCKIEQILNQKDFTKDEIVYMLNSSGKERTLLFEKAAAIKRKMLGDIVYFRGLIEFSNLCSKNCYYCGIRKDNTKVERYNLSDEEIIKAAIFAHQNHYGSVVLQSGERTGKSFVNRVEYLIKEIKKISDGTLGITLSLGEQTEDTYRRWFHAGAHRYLLRIETSDKNLYHKLHPNNKKHSFTYRLTCLKTIQNIGYQTGTGVMIGLPFQTIENLADDLLFMKNLDIDMVGMGPYIEHKETPLISEVSSLKPLADRFDLTLKMIAVLRIMMKDINIAATTALQAIDPIGREKAIKAGANIIMPNITPGKYRDSYKLYENKPCTSDEADDCMNCLNVRIAMTNHKIGYDEWGDSKHYKLKHNHSTI